MVDNLFRDFIYLDTERLKSIVAQLNQGLIENTSKTVTQTDGDKISGGIDFLKMLKIGGESSFLWQDQATESHTLHDYLYNLAETSLEEKELLIKIPGDIEKEDLLNPSEESRKLTTTSFILVKGKSFINDFAYLSSILDNLDEILKSIITGEQSSNKNFEKSSDKERNKIVKDRIKEYNLPNDLKKAIQTFLDNFYKDRLVIKSVPFFDKPNFRFVGTLNPINLRENIENIIFKYGTAPQEDWYMFAQVASIPHSTENKVDVSYNQNQIEKALQQVFEALRDFEKAGFSISFPEIAVTPIAIYRQ
ncbi:hypothetical protein GLV94_02535 [Virgibacillus halodenitrificans]|uniref:ATPase dynein-related AAA domain-containing protein n=1 Tax=Virgibacillus halodenitrificans TaxID=1482 RepID=A0ABR7VKC2_VIRHA|nr:hypothetical protein [Virgibacillus halodenitrificans]MBD1222370.1 hypothetical protein [Virgibacillus halodenitrificans]MYL44511.1 hypothetical protein [Virgibacillus halodenitrificans]